MIAFAIAVAAFLATLAGGLFALRLRDRLHLILGFSAGAVVAVAFFDLIPEALELGTPTWSSSSLLLAVAVGFLSYLVLDRIHMLRATARRGALGAASLSAHSFLDGVAIGVALHASVAAGTVVTIAVLTHDFSDGINTANIVVKNGGSRSQALRWLLLDAVTPALGIASTAFFQVSTPTLGLALALFAGLFLYVGASDLIPESHHSHPQFLTTAMTLLGAAVLYAAVRLATP
jgi:ZIP family zinc transporter